MENNSIGCIPLHVCTAQRIHISERTYYCLLQSGQRYNMSKRGQILLKVAAIYQCSIILLKPEFYAENSDFSIFVSNPAALRPL